MSQVRPDLKFNRVRYGRRHKAGLRHCAAFSLPGLTAPATALRLTLRHMTRLVSR